MLVHLAEDDERIDAVQIPRDTLMDLPACPDTGQGRFSGGQGMINSALNFGPNCSVAAAEELTGLRLDHFIEVGFAGFVEIVDALDGVPVHLDEPFTDNYTGFDLPAGDQTLDGEEALAWARSRHGVGDGSDIARLGHQQEVIAAIAEIVEAARQTLVIGH